MVQGFVGLVISERLHRWDWKMNTLQFSLNLHKTLYLQGFSDFEPYTTLQNSTINIDKVV